MATEYNKADILEEIESIKRSLHFISRNLRIVQEEYDKNGNTNVDLLFKIKSLQEQKLEGENRLRDLELNLDGDKIKNLYSVSVEVFYSYLPSGILHLYNADKMPLVKFTIQNNSSKSVQFVVVSEIDSFSFPRTDSLLLNPDEQAPILQMPTFDVNALRDLSEIRKCILHCKISYVEMGDKKILFEQDYELFFTARNVIQWAIRDNEKRIIPLLEHVVAWVTPRTDSVKTILGVAARKIGAISGYQGREDPQKTRDQVKAIFETLKNDVQLVYVNSPFAIGPSSEQTLQAIRLPRESLVEKCANCIDGTVLYASLLELASLEPLIFLTNGHAFVGWKTWKNSSNYEFLETTVTNSSTFDEAWRLGNEQYKKALKENYLHNPIFSPDGFARILDVKHIHSNGIFPME